MRLIPISDQWYLYKNEQQKGPFKWDELLSLARAGLINPEDKVMSSATKSWVNADQVDNLLNRTVPKEGPALHASESKGNSTLARFKLPLIILGALFGMFVFIAIIASLFDDSGPDAAPPDAGSSSGMTDMLTFNEPGYGFTMNYPREWSYGIDESGYVYFQGSQNTEEDQITVIVDTLPSRSAGGIYGSVEELYADEIDYYYLLHGESFGYETSTEQIGSSQHRVVYGSGTFEHQGELYSEIAIIIEQDSSTYYIITYNAPEAIFYDYQEKIFDVFISSFRFTS